MYEKRHVCRNCYYYNALYVKNVTKFASKSYGECGKTHQSVQYDDSCEQWRDNSEILKQRKNYGIENLISALEKINEIIQLLKEETPDG